MDAHPDCPGRLRGYGDRLMGHLILGTASDLDRECSLRNREVAGSGRIEVSVLEASLCMIHAVIRVAPGVIRSEAPSILGGDGNPGRNWLAGSSIDHCEPKATGRLEVGARPGDYLLPLSTGHL